jgi:uncharacterized protein involved in exopolysaccharide biosynthesis
LIADKHIIPRGYEHLHRIRGDFHSDILDREFTSFRKSLEEVIQEVNDIRKQNLELTDDLVKFQQLRKRVEATGDLISKFTEKLPS